MKIIKDISVSEFNTLSWLSFKFGFDMTDLDEYSKDIEISNSDAGDLKELIKSTLEEGVDKVNREKNLKSLFKKIGAVDNFIDIDINGRDFKLYIARSDEDKSRGLEAVSSLAADKGMYFPFDGNQYVTFHMGKVQFPIDIVFLSDFEITKIIKNAQPGSTDRWSAMADTVIELSGGICDEYNINEGDGCTKVLASKKGSKINHLKKVIELVGQREYTILSDLLNMVKEAIDKHGDIPVSGEPSPDAEYGAVVHGFEPVSFKAKWDGSKYIPISNEELVEIIIGESFESDEIPDDVVTLVQFKDMIESALSKYGNVIVLGPTNGMDYGNMVSGIDVRDNVARVDVFEESQFSSYIDEE